MASAAGLNESNAPYNLASQKTLQEVHDYLTSLLTLPLPHLTNEQDCSYSFCHFCNQIRLATHRNPHSKTERALNGWASYHTKNAPLHHHIIEKTRVRIAAVVYETASAVLGEMKKNPLAAQTVDMVRQYNVLIVQALTAMNASGVAGSAGFTEGERAVLRLAV